MNSNSLSLSHTHIHTQVLCDSTLVSAGENTVSLWTIESNEEKEDQDSIQGFYEELEYDHEGFSDELKDFFCYARVRGGGGGDNTEQEGQIRVSEIPNVCRGLGYYPTQFEIQRMISESKGKTTISRSQFVRLFVNHRVSVTRENVEKAFNVVRQILGVDIEDEDEDNGLENDEEESKTKKRKDIRWARVKQLLHESGEKFDTQELNACLSALLGDSRGVPQSLTSEKFVSEILGFN